ncbi:MAG: sigma-70 family RNA polymerase sigma factor [Planctomycetes bacterium]|nr:sigma-70 family RNA polymerase sigma factor [Planctomycetota bacterium]
MDDAPAETWTALARGPVHDAWDAARARYGALDVDRDELLRAAVARTLARFERAGREPDPLAFRTALERAALADLCLVLAWERGDARAWELYAEEFEPAVTAAARRQGASPGRAEELAHELPGLLLAAEAEGRRAPLARYDGSGSLVGWLGVLARRRAIDGIAQDARHEPLEARDPASGAVGPEGEASERELAERVRAAAAGLRAALTPRERLVLLLKHEHGLAQTSIAAHLGVTPSRVTRLVQHATEKLREALAQLAEGGAVPEARLSHVLLRALGAPAAPEERA